MRSNPVIIGALGMIIGVLLVISATLRAILEALG